jgi:hypothetical protein
MPRRTLFAHCRLAGFLGAVAALFATQPPARAAEPLTIGFDIEQTGGLAANGKAALLAQTETILWPPDEKNGSLRAPFSDAQH